MFKNKKNNRNFAKSVPDNSTVDAISVNMLQLKPVLLARVSEEVQVNL